MCLFVLPQSQSIRYLARKVGLLQGSPQEVALIESLQDSWTDLRNICVDYVFAPAEAKPKVKENLLAVLEKQSSYQDTLIGDKNTYFGKPTLADFALFDVMDQIVRIVGEQVFKVTGDGVQRVYQHVKTILRDYLSGPIRLEETAI